MTNPTLFGERLRVLRADRTLEEMAEIVGIPWHSLGRLERGETRQISLEDAVKLAKAYELTVDEMAALAELWCVPEAQQPQLAERLNVLYNRLLDLSAERQQMLLMLFNTLIDVELSVQQKQITEEAGTVALPAWLKQRQAARGTP